ncbi:hypothetical protein BDV93DRAFT_290434 [Ceratobasidium sp. AG-I]|nr:hypothetical protein BDV93DRAFT_290434 [Ceratobasidium sp. AG-I]
MPAPWPVPTTLSSHAFRVHCPRPTALADRSLTRNLCCVPCWPTRPRVLGSKTASMPAAPVLCVHPVRCPLSQLHSPRLPNLQAASGFASQLIQFAMFYVLLLLFPIRMYHTRQIYR